MRSRHRQSRFLNTAANVLLLLFSVAIVLAIAEAGFRAFEVRGWHEQRKEPGKRQAFRDPNELSPGVRVQFQPGVSFAHVYDSNPRGYFDDQNRITYEFNNYGFRGPDFEVAKPPGTRRAVLLGDSFTFGAGVHFEDTLGAQLQRLLNADSRTPVEVLSFAVGGWGTSDEINYLE
ncbi:MAG: SGNH/GDSL hydrolase family protein [Myxococcales bacterium]|nr:SGNH/GDSL hydrolase family protein [Myxococcales bacterium]